ncbi:Ger(x)C family spore germination protein [Enterococcus faecalis]|uniref:Ger(x)C family spore germination protein n=1 Tax=Enterococcus faecalis TaxID=1351 RepID=UPI002FDC503F
METFKKNVKTQIAFLLFFMVMLLSGCWSYKDINHRMLPDTIGISTIDDEYEVFLTVPITENDKMERKVVSAKGESISKAVDIISRNIDSSVNLLHVNIILIERGTSEEGINDIIAGFVRSRDVSNNALVAICDEDIEIFLSKTLEETNIYEFFQKNSGWDPEIILTRVWHIYRSIYSYTHDVAIPIIKSDKNTPMKQVGTAIMKNGKMVGQLSSEETLLINAFYGESVQGKVQVMNHATVTIKSNTNKHSSGIRDNIPSIHSKISLKVVIMETKGDPSPEIIKDELKIELTNMFYKMFAKIQDNEADILGLGQFFRNEIPRKELEDWRSVYYPKLKMDFQFHIDIQNKGYLRTT